jgi:archaellum biogenesis ATPase FlaH
VTPEAEAAFNKLVAETYHPVVTRLSDVQAVPVNWLWQGRVAFGKLTLVVGDPGLGKSLAALDMAARFTRGGTWPDGERIKGHGHVLLLSAEDDLADTVRPRLDAADAVVQRVHALRAVHDTRGIDDASDRPFNLENDLELLRDAIESTHARFVIIDPLSAYFGTGRDSYKDNEVRAVLHPLTLLAEQTRVAIVAVMHLKKSTEGRALMRVLGSVGFVAAARGGLAVAKDPHDENRRLVMTLKNNLAAHAATLALTIADGPRVSWDPRPVDGVNIEDVLGAATKSGDASARAAAGAFLREALADGREHPSTPLIKLANNDGISRATLFRAKAEMALRSRCYRGVYLWALPTKGKDGETETGETPETQSHQSHQSQSHAPTRTLRPPRTPGLSLNGTPRREHPE